MSATVELQQGERWAVAPSLDAFGDGMFRQIRKNFGVTAFGINGKVMQPGTSSRNHLHTEQQELIFVHSGRISVALGDGSVVEVGEGGLIRIDAGEAHRVDVVGDVPAVLLLMGGKGGIVEGDAVFPD